MACPSWSGNHTENFRDIVGLFQSRDAARVVSAAELTLLLMELISNPAARAELGRRGAETLRSQTGATSRTADALEGLLLPAASDQIRAGEGARATP